MAKAISIGKDENMHIGSTVCDIIIIKTPNVAVVLTVVSGNLACRKHSFFALGL